MYTSMHYADSSSGSSSNMLVVKVKKPSKMDVAPWNVHWIKMVLHDIFMVFVGTHWYCMVLKVTLWLSLIHI